MDTHLQGGEAARLAAAGKDDCRAALQQLLRRREPEAGGAARHHDCTASEWRKRRQRDADEQAVGREAGEPTRGAQQGLVPNCGRRHTREVQQRARGHDGDRGPPGAGLARDGAKQENAQRVEKCEEAGGCCWLRGDAEERHGEGEGNDEVELHRGQGCKKHFSNP